ncbi:hypothetical protein M569_17005 [Genlisea aurea]|uniref:Uncharacterized protein n=1 Tax=Genlisea aurea TaxID=192259 RepID=S8BTU9_9LAMI|nr:hypothetical protein M569_17005 [Genlisea aurea]
MPTVEMMIRKGILSGRRGVRSTPSPTWRFHHEDDDDHDHPRRHGRLSVRKLGSTLWGEMKPQHPLPTKAAKKLEKRISREEEQLQQRRESPEGRRARCVVLERLCDEFAKGILDYDRKLKASKKKKKKKNKRSNSPSFEEEKEQEQVRFILHVSEAWIDARSQNEDEDSSALDRLLAEVERFLNKPRHFNPPPPPPPPAACSLREMLMEARLEERK